MKTAHSESLIARIVRRVMRFAMRFAASVGIAAGFILVFLPFADVLNPEQALFVQKLVSVLGGALVTVVVGLGLFLSGGWLRVRVMKLRQAENDRTAQRIMNELRLKPEAAVGEFYLYLRAFESTGKLRVPLYLRLRKLSLGLGQFVTNDVESYVSDAVRKVAPLIALGQPGESVGAGRITTEGANWMTDIVTLMKRAKGILLVPASRPGTLWEIETLKQLGLLNKVVFIMPPRTKGDFDTKQRWELARQAMASHGLDAPEHQARGLLFEVGVDGKVSNVEPMLLNSVRQIRKSLQRILSDAAPKGGVFKAIAVADKRTRRAVFWGWVETMRHLSPYPLAALGLLVGHPDAGFNPNESWATVIDRSATAERISNYELSESVVLAKSEKYVSSEAQMPQEKLSEWRQGLLVRGLVRLDDEAVSAFYTAFREVLARVDTKTCAAIARGEIQPGAMNIALTYVPSDRIDGFLRARTAAILAEVEDAPTPPVTETAVGQAQQQFLAKLGPEGQQRYERINQAQGRLSDDDHCWFARARFGGVATLAEPHSSVWARILAASALSPDESTAANQPDRTSSADK